MAFESAASDITHGARRGVANIYAVLRRPPFAAIGSTWIPDRTVLVSRGLGGGPANGASWGSALSGDSANVPRCIAFLSRASNLVPGGGAHLAQAYLADLASGRIERVSVSSAGRAADRAVTEVAVSGDCRRVAFVSAATNLAQTRPVARWAGGRTHEPQHGTSQVYVRFRAGSGALTGLTMLASANGAHPANAGATGVSLSRNGDELAFVSAASDLGADSRGVLQVWERTLSSPDSPLRVREDMRLVSRAPNGGGGDLPSVRPSIDHNGVVVAFESLATNLLPGANGVWQIVRASLAGSVPVLGWVSQAWGRPDVGNGPSHDASITDGGEWIFFDSTAGNLDTVYAKDIRPPGPDEVYRWTDPELAIVLDPTHIRLESVGGLYRYASRTPAEHPDTSARGNYLPFESDDSGLDAGLGGMPEPPWYPGAALSISDWSPIRVLSAAPESAVTRVVPGAYGAPADTAGDSSVDSRLHQVYVHFLGSNG